VEAKIKVHSQVVKNGQIFYQKYKIPLSMKNDDRTQSCKSWQCCQGQIVITHQYSGFLYRIFDIKNDVDITIQRKTHLPIHFGRKSFLFYHYRKLFWLKKFKRFLAIGQTTDFKQTIVSNHECDFDLGDLGVRINYSKVCEKSNQLLFFTIKGLIIYDLFRFIE
jgi:hypothetical protein